MQPSVATPNGSHMYLYLPNREENVVKYVYDTRSVFSLNRKKFIEFTSFCQVIYFCFIRCAGKCLSQQVGIVLENFILNEIIYLICYIFIQFN